MARRAQRAHRVELAERRAAAAAVERAERGGRRRRERRRGERRRGESRGDVRGETTFFFRGSGFFSLEPELEVEVTEGHLAGSSLGCWERR